jgi:hypothetical protein
MWPCIVTTFFIIKPTRCTNSWNLFWNDTLHVSDSSSVHHQELFTVYSGMVYVIQVCRQLSNSRIRMELQFHPDPAAVRKLSTNQYDVYHCWVYINKSLWWREELSETCRVSFQNKFEESMHLVGFIIKKLFRELIADSFGINWKTLWQKFRLRLILKQVVHVVTAILKTNIHNSDRKDCSQNN